ncbi:MAG: metallophosphoesterase [Byssovorax sp.]
MKRSFGAPSLLLVTGAFAAACGGTATPGSTGSGGASPTSSGSASGGAGGASTTSTSGATSSTTGATSSGAGGGGDGVVSTFVYVGCNRLSKGDWDPAGNPSSANLAELTRTFSDVTLLAPVPQHFFFTGDLVLGLDPDTTILAGQLDAWGALYAADPSGIAAKVPVTPLPGNHEMLVKQKVNGTKIELSNPPADPIWTTFLGGHGFGKHAGNGPTAAGANPDALADDQSQLTYSFDDAGVHYVLLNTDTWTTTPDAATGSTQLGWIAMKWLTADLAAAQASAAVKHIVVLGHKPIVAPSGLTTSDEIINGTFTGALENLLDTTDKVRGYFCAHAHLWDARKLPGNRGVTQVIAGNGGSSLETTFTLPYFGFTEVLFHESGKVGVIRHNRPVPVPYNQFPALPATPQPEQIVSP